MKNETILKIGRIIMSKRKIGVALLSILLLTACGGSKKEKSNSGTNKIMEYQVYQEFIPELKMR